MKYFLLQLKRVFKLFPLVAVLIAVLAAAFAAVFVNYADFMDEEQNSRFKVGVVGEADNGLFSMGITAVKTVDTSRFSIDVIEISDENTAAGMLRSGEIAAYVVAPEGFTNAVSHGRIMPLKYCTTEGYVDVSAIFKDEITSVVSTYLKESQKGIFAAYGALYDNGYADIADSATNKLAIKYMDLILARSDMYKTETTGFSFGLSIVEYTAIGLAVTFICVFVIPFATLFSKKDTAFIRTLSAGGYGAATQVAAEFFAMLTGYLSVLALFIIAALAIKNYTGLGTSAGIYLPGVLWRILPVAATVCAFAYLVFQVSGNIITAVTGYFFLSFAMCFASGCVYPVSALPDSLQRIAAFTPTAAARVYLSKGAVGEDTGLAFLMLAFFTALFFALAVLARRRGIKRGEG